MKIITILLTVIAVALIVFNSDKVDINAPFKGESIIALITIIASLSAIILLQILKVSKRIEQKQKDKR